ncbi:MAG: transglutaminase domain-containing protein [Ruminococcaceae bacterium]|nr:transglutaminase domain-containing protein [Oscillospiraceae bacterium]
MKRSKLFAITLQSKSGLVFFFVLVAYNLLLGVYLKDFLVLSPVLLTFYLLSALPTLFFVLKIRSTPMRAIVLIVLFFVMVISIVSSLSCRRLLPMLTFVVTAIEMMYFGIVDNSSGKDKLLTKICVLVLTAFIAVLLFFSYNFVYKPEAPYLSNGRDTLWDTQTEELADEICADSDTDAEKVQAIYSWMIANLEYDHDYQTLLQYFDVRRTLRTRKGVCYDFANLFAALCRSQNIPCYVVDGTPYNRATEDHTWNRVYYDGLWWDLDVTNDISSTANGKSLYGFRELTSAYASDKDYYITNIY